MLNFIVRPIVCNLIFVVGIVVIDVVVHDDAEQLLALMVCYYGCLLWGYYYC